MPSELRTATFISSQQDTTTLLHVAGLKFQKEVIDGVLISADERAPNSARIILDKKGIYTLFLNGKSLYATSSPLAGVSVSPDGTMIAFAEGGVPLKPLDKPQLIPGSRFDSRSWKVLVLALASGAKTELGAGSAPLFLDATHVLYFAPGGIFSIDLKAQKKTLVQPGVFNLASVTVLQSPDRTVMGWRDGTSNAISIFRVRTDGVEKIGDITPIGGGASALGTTAVYSARQSAYGGTLQKQGFTQAKSHTVGSLPSNLSIIRIMTGSL
jgi:hypothetical protein